MTAYSKFGNTREQYFHAWRSFQYDESTDTIDSYIHRVKQVAALLNYGEPQILELFKNTLPSKLYYMLYHINDLREAVETAKRMLMKEQIDKQKSGQSSASSFMKASQQNSKKSEKGIIFGAMETIQRQGDSIDKLASLINELNTKLDRRENQYKLKIYREEIEDADKDRIDMGLETDPIVGSVVHIAITEVGEEIIIIIIMTEITDLTIGLIVGLGIEVMEMAIEGMIDMTIGLITEEIILTKIMEIKDTEIEV